MNKLQVEYVPIGAVREYENNAKSHPAEQIQQIKESIRQFGFNDPIAVWNNEIVEGHGRLIAAEEMGMGTVPVIRLDDMSDEDRRAYALVHNKTAELAEWDYDKLSRELNEISFSMDDMGFWEKENKEKQETGIKEKSAPIIMCPRCGAYVGEAE